jgi:hypothetical protein
MQIKAQSSITYYSINKNEKRIGGFVYLEIESERKERRFPFEMEIIENANTVLFIYDQEGNLFYCESFPNDLVVTPPLNDEEKALVSVIKFLIYHNIALFSDSRIYNTGEVIIQPTDPKMGLMILKTLFETKNKSS